MRMTEPDYRAIGIIISGTAVPPEQSRIRAQLHHTVRQRSTGIGVAVPTCPDEYNNREKTITAAR